jgi:hypothetical protein
MQNYIFNQTLEKLQFELNSRYAHQSNINVINDYFQTDKLIIFDLYYGDLEP